MKYLSLPLIFLLLVTYGCAPTNINTLMKKEGGSQLTPEQILSLVEGNTLKMTGYDSTAYLFLDQSGKAFGVDIYNKNDTGQWDVSDQGEFCLRMSGWWYSDLICYLVYQVDGVYKLTNSDGIIAFTASMQPGDYKNSFRASKTSLRKSQKRKSIRSDGAAVAAPVAESDAEAEPAASAEEPEVVLTEKSIIETNTYSVSQDDKTLRSTVKWMARDCPGCNLSRTDLKKADLVAAQLAGADLSGSNLNMANLRRADLQAANLEDANLAYCNMPGANLKDANLRGANLKGANLIRADLTGADVEGADFEGALLEGVVGLDLKNMP